MAFALGWQVAELYRDPHRLRPDTRPPPDDLPGIGSLTESERTELGLRQFEAGLHRLAPRIQVAGLTAPDTRLLRIAFQGVPDPECGHAPGLRAQLLSLDTATLQTLTAADFRLGKAYGLGRAMADTAEATDAASLSHRFDPWRIRQLDTWLADLDSALPAHASSSVRMSLTSWQHWASKPRLGERPLGWERNGATVRPILYRQAQRWRALLSGEKAGIDMLKTRDYLAATREMLSRAGQLFWGVVKNICGSWSRRSRF